MGVVTTGDTKINILYYFEKDNAQLFQYYEKKTVSSWPLHKTCPRKFCSVLNINLDGGMKVVQIMKNDWHILQEKLFLHILKSCKNQVYSKGLKKKSLMNGITY